MDTYLLRVVFRMREQSRHMEHNLFAEYHGVDGVDARRVVCALWCKHSIV